MRIFPIFPEQASTLAGKVDNLYFFLIAVSVFFASLIFFLVIYFTVKYHRRSDSEIPKPIMGDLRLELLWTIVPFLISMVIFFWGARLYYADAHPPADSLEIFTVAKQWMWKFQHPEGKREINELHVPVGKPVKMTMTSQDVIHSFYVPAFRIKMDVLPGRYTQTWFQATKPGTYHLFCAEYCGNKHSAMIGSVVVMELWQYQNWLASSSKSSGTMGQTGEKLFKQLGCVSCHGAGPTSRGPSLDGLFGRMVELQNGRRLVADEGYLRESILKPNEKMVAGYSPIMPTFEGQVTEDQVLQIISYLKSLGQEKTPPPVKI